MVDFKPRAEDNNRIGSKTKKQYLPSQIKNNHSSIEPALDPRMEQKKR